MTSRMLSNNIRSLALVFFGLALTLAACGSGGGEDLAEGEVETDAQTETESEVEPAALDGAEGLLPDLSGPVTPESVNTLVQALTGVPPGDAEVACLTDVASNDTQLSEVFNGFGQQGFELSPEAFTALAVNTHDCVERDTLVAAISGLSVLEGPEAEEFSTCIAEEIGDETNGDLAYTGLAALLVGFEIPEGAQQFTFDSVTTCVTAEDLTQQIVFNTESTSGFAVDVDEECISDGIDEDFINDFWGTFILGEGDADGIMLFIASCTSAFDSGLAQELPVDFEPWAGVGALSEVDPLIRNGVYTAPPPTVIEEGIDYQAVFNTSDGEIVIDLFEETAPITVNNFVALARDGFYDATVFHRVLADFMAQGGDPTSSGSGGPGYSFADEPSALTEIDRRGLLAMANSGPDTNGSQFFITFEPADFLNGLHAVFGEVIEGDTQLGEIDLRDPEAPTTRGEQLFSVVITEN